MKDSMTLSVLVRNIQKAHTPAPDIHMIDIFDTKNWIKPFVNKITNHVYPGDKEIVSGWSQSTRFKQ